ncbi:glycerol-3-phosphate acyltransferase [Anaerobacillus sp. MEB173]|uniref:glycerol-3-phosphate acyltransferase n=1 Tax=Anaerobacillus sp. MEB173 TaxID=3383345 RepID=UPI003F8FF455
MLTFLLFCIVAYIIGSIPTGKIIAKLKGIDIQSVGTKNIGASNMYLSVGKKLGFIVLVGDLGKAFLTVFCSLKYFTISQAMIIGLFVLVGNIKSIFLNFTGGKGIATSLGIFLAAEPIALVIMLGLWIIGLVFKKYMLVIGISAFFFIPYQFISSGEMLAIVAAFLIILFIFLRHKENIELANSSDQPLELK